MNDRRVALVTDTEMHLGPDLARELARRDHDLVVGQPAEGLVPELRALGAEVEAVPELSVTDLQRPEAVRTLVDTALARFGRIDAACIRTGAIRVGGFLDATLEDLHACVGLNIESVFHALQQLLPPMLAAGAGQIVIVTSASGAKPTPVAPLYSATRAAANMLVRNVALAVADRGVCINAVGTNFLDYPGFIEASGAADPDVRRLFEAQVPMQRLGQPDEAAHFCAGLLDGRSRFQTGQFFSISGGWSE